MATSDDSKVNIKRSSVQAGSSAETKERANASPARRYDVPESFLNLDDPDETPLDPVTPDGYKSASPKVPEHSTYKPIVSGSKSSKGRPDLNQRDSGASISYDIPDSYVNLDELATPSPVENIPEAPIYRHKSLEQAKSQEQEYKKEEQQEERGLDSAAQGEERPTFNVSRTATQLYVISYLILFSFPGTLARLGLQTLTFYPGAPVVFGSLWANFGGSLFLGFLSEDRKLFRDEWGTPTYHQQIQKARAQDRDGENGSGSTDELIDLQAAKSAHLATKKTIPLFIGLATGFCGCFTSFSSFTRDAFLALSNNLPAPLYHPQDYGPFRASTSATVSRNGGYSFMALLAVIILTVSLSLSGLCIGAHLAIALEPLTPSLPFKYCRKIMDPLSVFLAWGCWIGAVFLAIFPPDQRDGSPEIWRGRAVFALVFAPVGCLARFYASIFLNSKIISFPLGTFVVNVLGTAILGMSYDLQHVPYGGVIGCQVLQGIQDGFCGCLTTVSTWVSELSMLRRRNAYRYGTTSVVVALCFLIVIMGSLRWTKGFSEIKCTH